MWVNVCVNVCVCECMCVFRVCVSSPNVLHVCVCKYTCGVCMHVFVCVCFMYDFQLLFVCM